MYVATVDKDAGDMHGESSVGLRTLVGWPLLEIICQTNRRLKDDESVDDLQVIGLIAIYGGVRVD